MLVFEERGKPESDPEKNLSEPLREKTNKKLNPHMASTPGFEPSHIVTDVSSFTV